MKKKLSIALTFVLVIVLMGILDVSNTIYAKSKKMSLSSKKLQMYVGKTKTVKLRNASKRVKWQVANKKIVKIVKRSGKKNSIIKVRGLKAGKAKIIAKCNNKKYVIKVVVKKKKEICKKREEVESEIETTPIHETIVAEPETTLDAETSTIVQTPIVNKKVVASVKNDKITAGSNLILIFTLQDYEEGQTIRYGYAPEKFERYVDGEWINVRCNQGAPEPEYEIIDNEAILEFPIYEYYDLTSGHYRWTHQVNLTEVSVEFDIIE